MTMKMNNTIVLVLGLVMVASLASTASAIPGTATPDILVFPSTCFGFIPQGTLIASANPSLFNNGAACGRMYSVTCTGGTNQLVPNPCTGGNVTVRIVNLCFECQANQLALSLEAFSQIANLDAGIITIDYTEV